MIRRGYDVDAFVSAWQSLSSAEEVAALLGIKIDAARKRAETLIKAGYDLRISDYQRSRRETHEQKFWRRVDKSGECWLWTGAKTTQGYGAAVQSRGARVKPHRLSWEIHFGEIPDGLHVLHKCDNPPCVNPSHLFLGTPKTNAEDRASKLRQKRGNMDPNAKLTPELVLRLRDERSRGKTYQQLADQFGVSISNAYSADKGIFWGWVK